MSKQEMLVLSTKDRDRPKILHEVKREQQQMSEQPITGYKLSQLRSCRLERMRPSLPTSLTVKTPGDNVQHQMAVGEVWVKRNGQWLICGYSGTPL